MLLCIMQNSSYSFVVLCYVMLLICLMVICMLICIVLFFHLAAYDPASWKNRKPDCLRAMYTMFYYIVSNELTQVNGIVYLSDMTGLTVAHQTFWSMEEMRKLMKYWQVGGL